MTVTALLFASYADALGSAAVELQLDRGATVRDALTALRALPGAERLPPSPLVAVNLAFAPPDRVLRAGDEMAIIPPVAGG
jgi:molybdopterin converting factor small subunit